MAVVTRIVCLVCVDSRSTPKNIEYGGAKKKHTYKAHKRTQTHTCFNNIDNVGH